MKKRTLATKNCDAKSVSPGDGDHPVEVGLHEGEPREPHLGQEVKLDPVRVDPVRPAPDISCMMGVKSNIFFLLDIF